MPTTTSFNSLEQPEPMKSPFKEANNSSPDQEQNKSKHALFSE